MNNNITPIKVDPKLNLGPVQRSRIIEARREQVAELLLYGWSEARIADQVGVAPSTVHEDIVSIREVWQEATINNVAQTALLDLARLDFIISGQLPRAQSDFKAAEAVMKAIEQKARILGYDRGITTDVEEYIRSMVEATGYDPDKAVEIAQTISLTLKQTAVPRFIRNPESK